MSKRILSIATGGLLAGSIAGGSKKKETAPAPAPTTERVMPLPDDEAVRRARKASILKQRGRSGRSSTILSDSGDKLGSY